MPYTSSRPRIADSSSPVSAFSERCDWNSTIAAAIRASAPNRPSSALTKPCGMTAELLGSGAGERADAVDRVEEPVFAGQGSGEQFEQSPADDDADRHAGQQRCGGLEQRAAANLGPELVARQHQEHQRRDVERQADQFTDVIGVGSVAGDQVGDVPDDRGDHVEQQNPPGDPLAGGQRRGQQGQHERPGEAGVGEVEDVVVDELPRNPDEPPHAPARRSRSATAWR